MVVAPDSAQSAKSHSITQNIPISFKKIISEKGYQEYSCSGTPVDCVKIALHEISDRKPDFLLSGINHGTNTSISIIYSGTMAAAIEGSFHSIPSIGFSVGNFDPNADFTNTIPFIKNIIKNVISNSLPSGVCLNVNFPNTSNGNLKGVKVCRAARGTWEEKFANATNPFGKNAFWISGDFINFEPNDPDTDEYVLKHGYGSIVPIKVDFTAHDIVDKLKKIWS